MSAMGGKLSFREYADEVRILPLAGCIIGALTAVGCTSSHAQAERSISTYKVNRCGGSPRSWAPRGSEFGELLLHDRLEVAPNHFIWNETPVSRTSLHHRLLVARHMPSNVGLQLIFSGADDCRLVRSIRQEVDDTLRCGRDHKCVEYLAGEHRRDFPVRVSR